MRAPADQRRRELSPVGRDSVVANVRAGEPDHGVVDGDPELVLALAGRLVVPLRARNLLLLTGGFAPHDFAPRLNVFRVCLHPDGLAPRTRNFPEWSADLLGQVRRTIAITGDAALATMEREILDYTNLDRSHQIDVADWSEPPLLVPYEFDLGDTRISLFTTLTTFGTPRDVTLDQLAIELFFPADDHSASVLRPHPATNQAS